MATKPNTEVPQYRLTERAYLAGDKLVEEGEVIYFTGIPAHYMDPVNEAAMAMVEKHPSNYSDPVNALPLNGK